MDILIIEKTNTYYQLDSDLYVLGNKKVKNKKGLHLLRTCGYYKANKVFWAEQERKVNCQLFINQLKQYKIILFAFLGILILNIFRILKFNRNRKYNQKSYL